MAKATLMNNFSIPIMSDKTLGLLLALGGTMLFSIKPVLIKIAYQFGGDVTSIMSLRAFSSLPMYLIILVMLCRNKTNRDKVKQHGVKAVAVGILGYYAASYLDIVSLEFISAQLERLLLFLFPSMVMIISWLFYGTRPTKHALLAVFVGYLGVVLIVAHDFSLFGREVFVGSAFAILSALTFAFYLVWSKPIINNLGSQLFTSIGMGSAGIAIITHLALSNNTMTTWSAELITIGIVLGIFCTVIPSYLIAAAMARLTPTQLSVSSNIGPGITAIMAVILLDELFTAYHAAGLCLVIGSVVIMNAKKNA